MWQEKPLNGRTVAVTQRGAASPMAEQPGLVHAQFFRSQPVIHAAARNSGDDGARWARRFLPNHRQKDLLRI
jgi:hypothetical protein